MPTPWVLIVSDTMVEERHCGWRAASAAIKRAERNGRPYEIDHKANGCTGCYARTDAVVTRAKTPAEIESEVAARKAEIEFEAAARRASVEIRRRAGRLGRLLARHYYCSRTGLRVYYDVFQRLTGLIPPRSSRPTANGPSLARALRAVTPHDWHGRSARALTRAMDDKRNARRNTADGEIAYRQYTDVFPPLAGGVTFNPTGAAVRCDHCGCEWSPILRAGGGGLPSGWWRCPRGCNADRFQSEPTSGK